MAIGYAPRLPLERSSEDGYALLKNVKAVTQQNFKMLLLTSPGERIMDPNYGVGLRKYLFENDTPDLKTKLLSTIEEQVHMYIPYIKINGIAFLTSNDIYDMPENTMQLRISYAIPSMKNAAFLDIEIPTMNMS